MPSDKQKEQQLRDRVRARFEKDEERKRLRELVNEAYAQLNARTSELREREDDIIEEEKDALGIEDITDFEMEIGECRMGLH